MLGGRSPPVSSRAPSSLPDLMYSHTCNTQIMQGTRSRHQNTQHQVNHQTTTQVIIWLVSLSQPRNATCQQAPCGLKATAHWGRLPAVACVWPNSRRLSSSSPLSSDNPTPQFVSTAKLIEHSHPHPFPPTPPLTLLYCDLLTSGPMRTPGCSGSPTRMASVRVFSAGRKRSTMPLCSSRRVVAEHTWPQL